MTTELRVQLLIEEIKRTEGDLDRLYKRLAVARAELDKQRHDAKHSDLTTTGHSHFTVAASD